MIPSKEILHPNFFLIGTVKGGTTSLHRYLDQHPEVYLSPIKEVNYFSQEDIHPEHFSRDYRHDVDINIKAYLRSGMKEPVHIAHVTEEADYYQLFSQAGQAKAIGEMSLSYMLYPAAPQRIATQYPHAKIMAMLRDPAERAFSQYVMNLRQGKTLEKNFIREITIDDAQTPNGWGINHQYLYIGKYFEQLQRYYDVFPPNQIRIFLFDDYKRDPAGVVEEMFAFLGVDPTFKADTSEKFNEGGIPKMEKLNYWLHQWGIINKAKQIVPRKWREPFKKMMFKPGSESPKMTREERAFLVDYYRADILKLEALIGRNLQNWLKV
jgi:hypothetical protein